MKSDRLLLNLITAIVLLPLASAHGESESFEDFVRARMEVHAVVGVSIALVADGEIRTLPLGRERAGGPEVSADSLFQVGSVSKPVAAWVVMTLVEDGRLELDAPVSNYLSRWQLPASDFAGEGVTVRRLLSHTAGLSLHGYPGFPEGEEIPSLEASLSGATGGSGSVYLFQEPGAAFSYSGGGYTLLQLLVEEVTGQSFADYARQALFAPLSMESSDYLPDAALRQRLVTPHGRRADPIVQHDFRAQAAASLHSTAEDLARFVLANLGANSVLADETVALMHRGVAPAGADEIGLGFVLKRDGRIVGHSGSNRGWKANLQFAPAEGRGIVILTNAESGGAFAYEVLCRWDELLGPAALREDCAAYYDGVATSQRQISAVALLLLFVSAALLIRVLLQRSRGKTQFAWPASPWRRASLTLVLLALGIWGLALYTPIGGYLVAGAWPYFPTIDYLPRGFRWLSAAAIGLLVTLAVSCCVGRRA
ncbi:MAG: serine hydrolase domain-containing protein [Pseudomonadota bacterium]